MLDILTVSQGVMGLVAAVGAWWMWHTLLQDAAHRKHISVAVALVPCACFASLLFSQLAQQSFGLLSQIVPTLQPISQVGFLSLADVQWMTLVGLAAYSVINVLRLLIDTSRLLKFARRRRLLQRER